MKKIIKLTESDLTRIIKRVINENYGDRFTTITHWIDMMKDCLMNYDSIDCENINKKYEHFYCENLSEYSREKIENVLHNLEREKIQLTNSHFHDKLGN